MSCTGWRFGISPVIWPSLRNRREWPTSGTDCVSRKCVTGGLVRRYTICRIRHGYPRLRIYDEGRMVASMTVPSFDWGKAHVDTMISGRGLAGVRQSRRRTR